MTTLDRARIFVGKTSADKGFSSSSAVIRETALIGQILPKDKYAILVALYPQEGTFNQIDGYETRLLSSEEATVPTAAVYRKVGMLIPPEESHIPDGYIDQPKTRLQFELAAARLAQPSVIVAFGQPNGKEHISLFSIEGMSPARALTLVQKHLPQPLPQAA